MFGALDVPLSRCRRRSTRAPQPARASELQKAGAFGDRPQPGLELGPHETAGGAKVDVLPPVRAARHLQPLRRRLDACAPRVRKTGRPLGRRACAKQGIERGQLTVHADRGAAPKSKTLAQMFTDLGVDASHSRPRVSNDNPFSEAQFKTYKYQPDYPPERFGGYEHALGYSRAFFDWYCNQHRHSGIAMLTPADVHYGRADDVLAARQRVLNAAYASHPERFVKGPPTVPSLPAAVWINPPEDKTRSDIELH